MKRLMDLCLSIPAILLLSPVFLFICAGIWKTLKPPIFFTQTRPGLKGNPFKIYKFRTMTNERDLDGNLLPDAKRITELGKFLRNTSLDELPELINILKGDMSIVGPRPLLMRYLDRYTAEQARRHEIKPGLTGWAQINGRNAITWEEKFELDIWYVDNQSLLLDIKIMAFTIKKVLRRENISAKDETTMPEFKPFHSQTAHRKSG